MQSFLWGFGWVLRIRGWEGPSYSRFVSSGGGKQQALSLGGSEGACSGNFRKEEGEFCDGRGGERWTNVLVLRRLVAGSDLTYHTGSRETLYWTGVMGGGLINLPMFFTFGSRGSTFPFRFHR